MKISVASLAVCGSYLVASASAAATVSIGQQVGDAYSKNNAGVLSWTSNAVVEGHNDLSLTVPAGTSAGAMYDKCLVYCKEHKCVSFDIVAYKHICYFDTKSTTNEVLTRCDPNRPTVPCKKIDNGGAAYVIMAKAPAPAPTGTSCYGFGLKFGTAEVFLADTLPTKGAVIANLEKQCGKDDVCQKYVTCDPTATPCGSIAIPPDTKLRGKSVKPGVSFGRTRGEVKAKAVAACQKVLDGEGVDGECTEMASFCLPK